MLKLFYISFMVMSAAITIFSLIKTQKTIKMFVANLILIIALLFSAIHGVNYIFDSIEMTYNSFNLSDIKGFENKIKITLYVIEIWFNNITSFSTSYNLVSYFGFISSVSIMLYVWSHYCFSKKYELVAAKITYYFFVFILSLGLVPLILFINKLFESNDPNTDRQLLTGIKVERDEEFAIEALKSDLMKFSTNPFKKNSIEGMELFLGIKIPMYFEVLNFLVAGGMGSGKTSAVFMPIAQQVFERGDFIILPDVKGDYSQVFSGDRGVMIFSPIDERSAVWAIAMDIKTTVDAEEFSATLIQSKSNDDNFFTLAARDVLSGILQALQAEKGGEWSFKDIVEVCSSLPLIYRCLKLYRPGALQVLSDTPDEGQGPVGKQSAGVLGTLRAYTQTFDTLAKVWPDTKKGFSISNWINFIDEKQSDKVFSKQKRMIILPFREEFSKLTGFFVSAVLNHLFREIMSLKDSKDRKIHCMMDEAGVFPRIPSLAAVSKTGRSKGLRLYFGLQEVGVVNSIFRQDGGKETILNSFSIKLIGRAETPEFANYFASTFGKNTYKKINRSSGKDSKGHTHTNKTVEKVVEDAVTSGELMEIPAASLENGAIFYVRIPGCSVVRLRLPINPLEKKYPNIVESKILSEPSKAVQGASIYDAVSVANESPELSTKEKNTPKDVSNFEEETEEQGEIF